LFVLREDSSTVVEATVADLLGSRIGVLIAVVTVLIGAEVVVVCVPERAVAKAGVTTITDAVTVFVETLIVGDLWARVLVVAKPVFIRVTRRWIPRAIRQRTVSMGLSDEPERPRL
jgi:hypothetical protein